MKTARVTATVPSPPKVCMYVFKEARNDARVMREATALKDGGFAVTIIDVEGDHKQPVQEEIQGVCVSHVIMPSSFFSADFKYWTIKKAVQIFMPGTLRLLQTPADIYHAHDISGLLPCYIAARLHRKPLIFDAHELLSTELTTGLYSLVKKLLIRYLGSLLAYCADVITVSPPIAREMCNFYHLPSVSVVRNVPAYQAVPKNDRLRQLLGLNPETRIALYQGYFLANRGLDVLIRAAAFLEPNIVIVLMGMGFGDTLSQLEALIASEGVSDRVKIIPPVPYAELLDWTSSADIGLCVFSPDYSLSIRWSLPNKFFEYLMAGLPVLSTDLDAIVEVIKTYDVGQLVSSFAPADIGAGINALLADPAALARMHRNALHAAQQEFNWEKESKELIHIYRNILGIPDEKSEDQKISSNSLSAR